MSNCSLTGNGSGMISMAGVGIQILSGLPVGASGAQEGIGSAGRLYPRKLFGARGWE